MQANQQQRFQQVQPQDRVNQAQQRAPVQYGLMDFFSEYFVPYKIELLLFTIIILLLKTLAVLGNMNVPINQGIKDPCIIL
ncbi:hypothetical protein FGO68_gene13565 [Halteria grandinella]|uniref:Uncharacterized protein n=1 Tax=Halteria grandinella TaxID=5974 RepID=A0A8J8NJU0_HALGN|nr:hypothetical protein FGO68_gene13565 [Halteria grandinella]